MYNQKAYELGSNRSCIRELFEYGRMRAAIVGAENVYDYSLGNPSIPSPPEVNAAIRAILEDTDPLQVHGYTSAVGDAAARQAIADDLNIAPALAAAFDLMRGANRLADSGELSQKGAEAVLALFREFDRVIGCFEVDAVRESAAVPAEVTALAEARAAARKAKDFAESDRLRDELTKLGWAVKDVPGGAWELKKL